VVSFSGLGTRKESLTSMFSNGYNERLLPVFFVSGIGTALSIAIILSPFLLASILHYTTEE